MSRVIQSATGQIARRNYRSRVEHEVQLAFGTSPVSLFSPSPNRFGRRRCFVAESQIHNEEAHSLSSPSSHKRNPVFAEVLREGLPLLHETAASIQASRYTRQSLFHHLESAEGLEQEDEETPPGLLKTFHTHSTLPEYANSPKYQYTVHHVREAAMVSLENLQTTSTEATVGNWSVQGEIIQILHVHLSSSLQHAILYWTLPYSVTDELSDSNNLLLAQKRLDHVLELQEILDRRWSSSGKDLARKIQGHLKRHNKWIRVPAIRFEPATPVMLYDYVILPKSPA